MWYEQDKKSRFKMSLDFKSGNQIGNIVQGNGNKVKSQIYGINDKNEIIIEEIHKIKAEIECLAEAKDVSFSDFKKLMHEVEEMENLTSSDGSIDKILSTAKTLYENYGWAKNLFSDLINLINS